MSGKIGSKRWGIVVLLGLAYLVLYMDRANISMAGSSMIEHFGWSATEFGLVQTAFFVGYILSHLPGGLIADKFGGGRVIAFGALFWSLFVFLTPFAVGLTSMLIIRALMGAGEGMALPAIHATIAKWLPRKETGRATGIVQSGIPMGMAITMPLATWIIVTWNWKMVFYSFAILGPIWVLVWFIFGKDSPKQHPKIRKSELEYIEAGQEAAVPADNSSPITKRDVFATKSVWFCAMAYFCANYLFFLFMTWLPNYFVIGRGIDIKSSAIFAMMPYLVAIFTYPLGGVLADAASRKFGQNIGRKLFPIIGLSIAGILLILGSKAGSVITAVALISASNGFLTLTMGGFFTMPIVFSQKNAGTITGIFFTLGTLAGILAPSITGLIIDQTGSYNIALYVGALVAMVGATILITLCKIKPIVAKHQVDKGQSAAI